MIILGLVFLFGIWGFAAGIVLFCILVATNTTVTGKRRYLYPLLPFDGKVMLKHLFRVKKNDFEKSAK